MDSVIFLPSAGTDKRLLKTPLETQCVGLLLIIHCVGSLVFLVTGGTLAHTSKVIQMPTLEASPCSSWACILFKEPHSLTWCKTAWPVPAKGQPYDSALYFSF